VTARARLELGSPGVLASVQDLGRLGSRRFGVPTSGAIEPAWLRIANVLAGAREEAPAIEFFLAGPTLTVLEGTARAGLAGEVSAVLERAGERHAIGSWRSVTLRPGDVLRVGSPRPARVGYLALRGLEVADVLGSASTFARAALGGFDGRPLHRGDVLVVASARGGPELALPAPPAQHGGPVRAVPGPQDDHLEPGALARFFETEWLVTNASDRMGMRLDGPALAHRSPSSAEIVSDAIVPGAIQVPGNGLPIVLLADCQTIGGYPKIATVASADLPRLAVRSPGARVRFARATVAEAEALARAREAELRALLASIRR
jgi:5-oxoprolinase (ATP-hydrolysing) subunit C